MDFCEFNFEEFIKAAQANQNNNNNQNNDANKNCNDIPGGFQDLSPQLFTLMSQILGIVMSENLPFNLQNAIGNWFELLGQVILTFNCQQQYFQSGPGRCYDLKFKNVTNPFCPTPNNNQTYTQQTDNSHETKHSTKVSPQKNSESQSNINVKDYKEEINKLKESINDLKKEIDYLKNNMKENRAYLKIEIYF